MTDEHVAPGGPEQESGAEERTPYRVELDAVEGRVFGVLVEKSFCTPEAYPLSLNALTAGCNQKTNRDPVTDLGEDEVEAAAERLIRKHLVRRVLPQHGRVDRYAHRGQGMFVLDDGALATLAELLLRGPQTAGELRARVSRMRPVATLEEMASILERLQSKGYARSLPPAPGSRARRFAQTLTPLPEGEAAGAAAAGDSSLTERVEALEAELQALRRTVAALCRRLGMEPPPAAHDDDQSLR